MPTVVLLSILVAATPSRSPPSRTIPVTSPAPPASTAAPELPPLSPLLPTAPALPTAYRGVLVYVLPATDVDEALIRELEHAILAEIDDNPHDKALTPTDVQSDLTRYGLALAVCGEQANCLAQASRYGRAHLLLLVTPAGIGGVSSVSLRLYDSSTSVERGRVTEILADDFEHRLQQLRRMILQLLHPETYVGDLTIMCSEAGAGVYLDDHFVGNAPVTPLRGLPAGLHTLRISKPGFTTFERFVEVVFSRMSTVRVDLQNATVSAVIVEVAGVGKVGEIYLVTGEAGVEVRIDGEPFAIGPGRAALTPTPVGKHQISVRRPGKSAVMREVVVRSGERVDILLSARGDTFDIAPAQVVEHGESLPSVADLRDILSASAAIRSDAWPPTRKWLWPTVIGMAGAGLASLGLGTYYAVQVDHLSSQAKNLYATATMTVEQRQTISAELTDLNARGQRAQVSETAYFSAGAVLALGSAGLITWSWLRPATATPAVALAPQGNRGLGMTLTGAW